MRFVTFVTDGNVRAGLLEGDLGDAGARVVDLAHPAFASALGGTPPQVLGLVEAGLQAIAQRLAVTKIPPAARSPLADVRLLAPIPRPRRIVAAAHNYRCALAERGMVDPETPVLFEKGVDTVVGPGEAVVLPAGVGGVTYEAELAVVIGRRTHRVAPEDALDHVAGYAVLNDISASEVIRADKDFARGKNFPTFAPFGPYLATPDEIGDPQALTVRFAMDGHVLQSGSTADMVFTVADLIARLSDAGPLEPGDVIATGTPAGVAPLRTPPTWLRDGAAMEASVEGLGVLCNPVVEMRT